MWIFTLIQIYSKLMLYYEDPKINKSDYLFLSFLNEISLVCAKWRFQRYSEYFLNSMSQNPP